MKNTKDFIPEYPAHVAPPVQTVGSAFSTMADDTLGYHFCREFRCLTRISKGGPLLCPEHQFACESRRTTPCQPEAQKFSPDDPAVLALEEILKFLPELEKLVKALTVISKSISAGETGGTP